MGRGFVKAASLRQEAVMSWGRPGILWQPWSGFFDVRIVRRFVLSKLGETKLLASVFVLWLR